jgi:hypothetical protein
MWQAQRNSPDFVFATDEMHPLDPAKLVEVGSILVSNERKKAFGWPWEPVADVVVRSLIVKACCIL